MTNKTLTDILGETFATKGDLEALQEAMVQKILSTAEGSGGDLVPELFEPSISYPTWS